jgi:predicted metal-dependent enzyme (double-stranded beta helix superfamily)
MLGDLVANDDWIPGAFSKPDPEYYRQYLLHCDSDTRFSIVSFVWGPGQSTPIHNHTVWGLIGMLRGAEISQGYRLEDGLPVKDGEPLRLEPGNITAVSPTIGDIHKVSNAYDNDVSISIHVYGADIGAIVRSTYQADGISRPFVSRYANEILPNARG